ncbi:zinc-binding dehydrogenase [Myxococcus sp. CA040A]|uniref:zinc-binding dehydrogenase n=1 Tax=Myxococcus sp. CA040A TaxID=2741738 RepID=UPI00157A86B6|nr:zinc-binding dehydrogenase [Myxococcus sp. CA040A]NTX09106.1 zinc-binding dehydrogenase [Myxococcus sp. CA040A]
MRWRRRSPSSSSTHAEAKSLIDGRGSTANRAVSSTREPLAAFGHLVAYGSASGPPAAVEVETLYAKSLKVSAYWLRTPHPAALQRRAREALGSALAGGQLRVKLGLVVGLEEAAQAHQRLESRATVGKVVLRVP